MKSPAPGEVMGIGNMLNQKGGSAMPGQAPPGTAPEHHPVPQLPQIPLERADSPHGSEHSRYSATAAMNALGNGRPYGSPSAMHAPLHIPEPNMAPAPMVHGLAGIPPDMTHALQQGQYKPPDAPQPPPKAYPCSTCGKGFARRSDLARHGE